MAFCEFYVPEDKLSELRKEENEAREARAKRIKRKFKQEVITRYYPILLKA